MRNMRMVISNVNGIYFKKGIKARLRYPSQMSGYIQYTYISIKAAEEAKKNLEPWARSRAKITPLDKRRTKYQRKR